MSGLGDSIGTMIEGGLLSRAVEPARGSAHPESAHGSVTCANCQTVFAGHYCPECGQKAHLHRTLSAIGHDIIHGVLHLDGKLWNTLPLLALKPGELTRRFIAGERAKFVSPMAMFLFSVFAMFAVFQAVGVTAPTDFAEGVFVGLNDESNVNEAVKGKVVALEKERDALPPDAPRRETIDGEIRVLNKVIASNALNPGKGGKIDYKLTGIKFLDEGIIKKWTKNPGLMLYKLQANGYKFSWLLIPLSLPFVWLLFAWRTRFHAYDHAVFVTYSLSFMSLLFIAMSLIALIPDGDDWAGLLFIIAAPLHLYKQLRYAYGLSRFSALWRFGVLFVCIQIVMVLFLQVLLILGAF